MKKLWIGCSGFHYKTWKGEFYPQDLPQSKWFEYYASRFNTLELNVTFYRFPRLPFLRSWYRKSPANFRFSVKAPRLITHYKKFIESQQYLADFYGTVKEGLGDKVGCVLFQLPPQLKYNPEKLRQILDCLDPFFKNVLEFRDQSWWNTEVYAELAKSNVTFCGISHPQLPDQVVQNTPVVYYRFHGVPVLYRSAYSNEFLHAVADQLNDNPAINEVFLYFNNDIEIAAVKNAVEIENYIKMRS